MSWIAVTVIGAGAAAAGGAMAASAAGQEERQQDWLQNPEYPHSQDARDLWWQKLQDWEKDPNYGAVTPDWDNIWGQVQNRVKQYYQGGPLNPGVKQRIESSLARKGMSENPASEFLKARVDAQEANDLRALDTEIGMNKANLAESGRNTWLNSIQNFQAQKPSGTWDIYTTDPGAQQKAWGNMISGVGSSAASMGFSGYQTNQQNKMLQDLLKQDRMSPDSFATGLIYGR